MPQKVKFERNLMQTESEQEVYAQICKLMKNSPLPTDEVLENPGLFIIRKVLSRILFLNELYQKIINIHGQIFDLGTRWGHNATIFSNLRGIYEPYNHSRKIIAFDSFKGFVGIADKDAQDNVFNQKGKFSVTEEYEQFLNQVLFYHEKLSPLAHIKKYKIIKGDATKSVKKYLEKNPETIVSLAYFDFDVYQQTKECLKTIINRMPKGGIIVFDELSHHDWPGETTAYDEVLGIKNYTLHRTPLNSYCAYIIL